MKALRPLIPVAVMTALVLVGASPVAALATCGEPATAPNSVSAPVEQGRHQQAAERLKAAHASLYPLLPMQEDLREVAERYAERATAGEFEFQPGMGDGPAVYMERDPVEGDDAFHLFINRMTPEQADAMSQSYEDLDAVNLDPFMRERLDVTVFAVSTDGEWIYEVTHVESIPDQ